MWWSSARSVCYCLISHSCCCSALGYRVDNSLFPSISLVSSLTVYQDHICLLACVIHLLLDLFCRKGVCVCVWEFAHRQELHKLPLLCVLLLLFVLQVSFLLMAQLFSALCQASNSELSARSFVKAPHTAACSMLYTPCFWITLLIRMGASHSLHLVENESVETQNLNLKLTWRVC